MTNVDAAKPNRLIGIVEDEIVTRYYWETLLRKLPGVSFLRSWESAEGFLLDENHGEVDLLLVDLELPGVNGKELIRLFKQEKPEADCIVLTSSDNPDDVFDAIRCGASGYLVKGLETELLLTNLQSIVSNGIVLSPGIARLFVQEFLKGGNRDMTSAGSRIELLTPRELQVLHAIQQFGNAKDVAAHMGLSHETVRVHMKKMYQKLHVRSKNEAVAMLREGTAHSDVAIT